MAHQGWPGQFVFYSKAEYFEEFFRRVDAAGVGERVMVATMAFVPEDLAVKRVLEALARAARRGAVVTFVVDAFPFLVQSGVRPGPLFYHSKLPAKVAKRFRPVQVALEDLRDAGVKCALINQPVRRFSLPFGGRSHIKFGLVGDRLYIGGAIWTAVRRST